VRDVRVPAPQLGPLTRSVVACLAAVLELEPEEVPAPPADHPQPWTVWREWLGRRGLGLVPVQEPATFGWPGPWLALLRRDADAGQVCAVAFGVPPGLAWKPLDGPESFAAVEAGYVVAPADVAVWAPVAVTTSRRRGRVEALALAAEAEAPMTLVAQATARAGRGLEGDRYFAGSGTFSNRYASGRDLTLIEAEALESPALLAGGLPAEQARRNVITRGIDLNALVGRRFTVGDVKCTGQRLCEPCAHLERLTRPGTLRGLVHRGGLRADLLSDGMIRVGDEIVAA
jgi:hypothetical protein